MKQQSYLVAYFTSDLQADSAHLSIQNLQGITSLNHRGTVFANLARSNERVSLWHGLDVDIERGAEILRDGMAESVLVMPSRVEINTPDEFTEKLIWANSQLEATWIRELESLRSNDIELAAAAWGVAEAVDETVPTSMSLIEPRYVIIGSVERILSRFKSIRRLSTKLRPNLNAMYKISKQTLVDVGVETSEDLLGPTIRRLLATEHPRYKDLEVLRDMFDLSLIEELAKGILTERNIRYDLELATRVADLIMAASTEEIEGIVSRLVGTEGLADETKITIIQQLTDADEIQDKLNNAWKVIPQTTTIQTALRNWQKMRIDQLSSFSQAVYYLRASNRIDWRLLIEEIDPAYLILFQDPSDYFRKMTIQSRTHYRMELADIAAWSGKYDDQVASTIYEMAKVNSGLLAHVGTYIVGPQRLHLEQKLGVKIPLKISFKRELLAHPTTSLVAVITAWLAVWILITIGLAFGLGVTSSGLIITLLLLLLPLGDFAFAGAHRFFARQLPPRFLAELDFSFISDDVARCIVAVPTMLRSAKNIDADIHRLEIRYLANKTDNLCFGLLTDWADSPYKSNDNDDELLEYARKGIDSLSLRYPEGKFFLYHRERVFAPSEDVWMGAERKRGKLEDFMRFCSGKTHSGSLIAGNPKWLGGVDYLLSLDADTDLPPSVANRLLGVMQHPLNQPRYDDNGVKAGGYSIIQPQVQISFESTHAGRLASLLAALTGVDPYIKQYNDVYFDLADEGIYYGKGLIHIPSFMHLVDGVLPDSLILSHDLLEGSYMRVGLATDIVVYEENPSSFADLQARAKRWMRGDWQIWRWFSRTVPANSGGRVRNPLIAINRFKIFDNLRRSLVKPAELLTVLVAALIGSQALFIVLILLIAKYLGMGVIKSRLRFQIAKVGFFELMTLPAQALTALEAVIITIWRLMVTHKKLLEWRSATDHSSSSNNSWNSSIIFNVSIGLIMLGLAGIRGIDGLPMWAIGLLWLAAGGVVPWFDGVISRESSTLSEIDRAYLRGIAVQTWFYFAEFMVKDNNYLPPDNYQTELKRELAKRTSPTNIGMGLLAHMEAVQFGFTTASMATRRTAKTIEVLNSLEKYKGNLYNWYDTQTLEAMSPRYVSLVDSGNLVASLWAYRKSVLALADESIIQPRLVEGIINILTELRQVSTDMPDGLYLELNNSFKAVEATWPDVNKFIVQFNQACNLVKQRESSLKLITTLPGGAVIDRLVELVSAVQTDLNDFFGWYLDLCQPDPIFEIEAADELDALKNRLMPLIPSLNDVANFNDDSMAELKSGTSDIAGWAKMIIRKRKKAINLAKIRQQEWQVLAEQANMLANNTDFVFLYDKKRHTFHIGYNLDTNRLDASHYDLLASEARTASIVAIASGQIPPRHWWVLGRNTRLIDKHVTLLSWSGTMFEYLMPFLFMKPYEGTILEQGQDQAVRIQMAHAKLQRLPWGISESAHSDLDVDNTYQYRAFGAPPLAVQFGSSEKGVVVAPYASGLAGMVFPDEAIANLKHLEGSGARGRYGFYDAVDYRRPYRSSGERGLVVYTYMAHHQGMMLLALSRMINDQPAAIRFQSDLRIEAVRSLLQEQPASRKGEYKKYEFIQAVPLGRLMPMTITNGTDELSDRLPRQHVLSNGNYTVMTNVFGEGYSRWKNAEIGRWQADPLVSSGGTSFYIRDVETSSVWSPTYRPVPCDDPSYRVSSLPEKIIFDRTQNELSSHLEVMVAPNDDVEIRHISLTNNSSSERQLELTSYLELGMAAHDAQLHHPSFNRLFIGVEPLPEHDGILANRRQRTNSDEPLWVGHMLVNLSDPSARGRLQTDRAHFLGRNSHSFLPEGVVRTTGVINPTVDPIASVKQSITIESGAKVELVSLTIAASSRREVLQLAERYRQTAIIRRTAQLAWTVTVAELQHLQLNQDDVNNFQHLSAYLTYPNRILKSAARGLIANRNTIERNEELPPAYDILAIIGDASDLSLVRQLAKAAAYLNRRGFNLGVTVIIKRYGKSGIRLTELIEEFRNHLDVLTSKPGLVPIAVVELDRLTKKSLATLITAAKVILDAEDGNLYEQLFKVGHLVKAARKLNIPEPRTIELPPETLEYQNNYGGFGANGRSYIMNLDKLATPAPWVNVIANSVFGTLVTERGGGFSWDYNSIEARLTPWRNDPANDRPAEAWYVWDQTADQFWPVLPSLTESSTVTAEHTPGLSRFRGQRGDFEYKVEITVPQGDSRPRRVRVSKLTLINHSSVARELVIAAASEMVLGTHRETDQTFVRSAWNQSDQSLLMSTTTEALSSSIIYSALDKPVYDYTFDRAELLTDPSTELPVGLCDEELSGRVGIGLDPMAALRTKIKIEAGAKLEVSWFLGAANNSDEAANDINKLRANQRSVVESSTEWWRDFTGAISIKTPERSTDIMINNWLPYQIVSSRLWGRTGYYQSSGAYGFRDQLQDVMSLLYVSPKIARQHIIEAAHHQFVEGDVQHWWMPLTHTGMRTHISDDLLWLPFVVAEYIKVTGDHGILKVDTPYLEGPPLKIDDKESYFEARVSPEHGSILEHCIRAIQKSQKRGINGLPLIGGGDWCDGYDRVGYKGQGESVWLAWFLITVEEAMIPLLKVHNQDKLIDEYTKDAAKLRRAIEATSWDGAWYRRAYYDDGTPLGSANSEEGQIDSLAQSWSVIAGGSNSKRQHQAIDSAIDHLVDKKARIVKILATPYDKTTLDPGYIRGYIPGVRENGGQYTHGSIWLAIASSRLGRNDEAVELLQLMNPILHGEDQAKLDRYAIEPYVMAGDVYAIQGQAGMGGWSWYTGSASWMYKAWIEEILGLQIRGNTISIAPRIPASWPGFELTYRFGETEYNLIVHNNRADDGKKLSVDGAAQKEIKPIKMIDDAKGHTLEYWLA